MQIGPNLKPNLGVLSGREKTLITFLAIFVSVLAIVFPIIISGSTLYRITTLEDYKVGQLADETIFSPVNFSYIDETETQRLIEEAENSVLPRFRFSVSDSIIVRNRANDFLKAFLNEKSSGREFLIKYELEDPDDVIGRLEAMKFEDRKMVARLIEECTFQITMDGILAQSDIDEVVRDGKDEIVVEVANDLELTIVEEVTKIDDTITKDKIPSFVLEWVSKVYPTLTGEGIALIADGVELLTVANVLYDNVLTQSLKNLVVSQVPPVLIVVNEGDILLEMDTVVTEQQLRTIDMINKSSIIEFSWRNVASNFVFVLLMVFTLVLYLLYSITYDYRKATYISIILSIVAIVQFLDFVMVDFLISIGIFNFDSFIPFFILPMLTTAITLKKRDGFIVGVFYATLKSVWSISDITTFFFITIASMLSIAFIQYGKDRISGLYQCIISAFAVAVTSAFFSLMRDHSWFDMGISAAASAINVACSFIVMSITLPLFEKLFNIPTGYRLHELSFTDTPALNRLNQVALGTYNHVKNVSDMAYAASKAIGANAALARVGALYHDIGKSEHPEYFIENQSGKNAHDDISSTLSAAILKSHVKLGVEKGKEIGLPQEVIDIIGEHHGNDLIKYFYNEAMKNNKNPGNAISEEDFRYTGKIPSTPESAVVMLADCVEAATRTIKNPNHQKYDKFISSIVSDKISHNQLNNSKLTITDLDKIKEAFIHQLLGRDHHRIEYDNDK